MVCCKCKKGCLTSTCSCQKVGLHCTDVCPCSEECVNGVNEETSGVELEWEDNVNEDFNDID